MLYGAMNSPLKPILEELESIADMGFDYLELTMDPPMAHYRQVIETREKILAALERHRLSLICHMPTFVSLADLTESIRRASLEEVLESLSEAARLQPLKIVLHPPYFTGLGAHVPDLVTKYALESLALIIQRGRELKQTLCLENMPPSAGFCTAVDEMAAVLNEFSDVHLTLDIGHANIGQKHSGNQLTWLKALSGRLQHLHFSDNHGQADEHLPLGHGNIDFYGLIRELKQIGYDKTVTFEIFSEDRRKLEHSKEMFIKQWASTS